MSILPGIESFTYTFIIIILFLFSCWITYWNDNNHGNF
jgi:hypothetical protein